MRVLSKSVDYMTAGKMNNICLEFNAFSTFKGFHEFSIADLLMKCFKNASLKKGMRRK